MRKAFCLLITLHIFICLNAQQQRQYSFTHYNVSNGLLAYHVNQVIQDEQGFIWIATIEGLQRFDGSRFLTFRHNASDSNSIPDNHVSELLLDKKNNLWLVGANGIIGRFNTRTMRFKSVNINAKVSNLKGIRRLTMDSKGNLFYTFVFSELFMYDSATDAFVVQKQIFKTPPGRKIMSVLEQKNAGKYWLSTDSGFAVYNTRTGNINYSGHNPDQEQLIEKFGKLQHATQFLIDSKNRIWFHFWPPKAGTPFLYCYDLANNKLVFQELNLIPLVQNYIEPHYIIEQKDGRIWISGLNILGKYKEDEKTFEMIKDPYQDEQSINYKAVHKLFEDKEHNIWVPTSNNGLYLFNPSGQLFTSIKHINRSTNKLGGGGVMSFVQTASGDILIGTWGDGVYRYDAELNLKPIHIKGVQDKLKYSAWSICKLKDNRTIWMAMQPGILVYDEVKNEGKYYLPPILGGKTNRQVKEDKLGNVWVGSHNIGVFKWIPALAKNKFEDGFTKINKIPDDLIEKIEVDSKGFVWICTASYGVYKLDPVTNNIVEHITTKGPADKRLTAEGVGAVLEYNDSLMIIVAGALNVYNTKKNTITHITSADGLPSDMIMSIEKDKDGFLWLGLFNGLCKMNFHEKTFSYYDRNDGMLNDKFSLAGSIHLSDGRMLFGTSDDFLVFHPEKVKSDLPPPTVAITDFRILNKPVLVDSILQLKIVELSHDDNSILVGFAGLSYFSRYKLTFQYMMEGIDKEWKKSNVLNQATYNYLPPGDYVFKVRALNGDGELGNISNINFTVKPPFWKTPWFIGVIAFIALAVLYWIDKFRMATIIDNQKTRTTIATSLTKDMSTTLHNINVLSEMAKYKTDQDIERTKEYVSQISENSNRMIEVMDDMVWSINPENDGMDNIIQRMKKYASLIQQRFNVEINFYADPSLNSRRMQMDRRHELFLIFKEIVLNLGKHSNSRFADIRFECIKSKLVLQVMDDGKGFDTDSVIYGRGLNEIRNRAAFLDAKLEINSTVNNGTTIRLVIPF